MTAVFSPVIIWRRWWEKVGRWVLPDRALRYP